MELMYIQLSAILYQAHYRVEISSLVKILFPGSHS
nr:MAG TPA: hypothetical protein [Bacteriophage sp.]